MALFDEQAKREIERAIAQVEQRSASEIVVVSVRASDAYAGLRLSYASAIALSSAAAVHLLWPELPVAALLWLEILAFALTWLLTASAGLLRVLLPAAYAQGHVERRAREVFFERELFATRERSGVLILLSELERRVAILGDTGIHAAVRTEGWQTHVQRIVAAVRAGQPATGVCQVILALGDVLATGLPRRPDDRDELPNQVLEER